MHSHHINKHPKSSPKQIIHLNNASKSSVKTILQPPLRKEKSYLYLLYALIVLFLLGMLLLLFFGVSQKRIKQNLPQGTKDKT